MSNKRFACGKASKRRAVREQMFAEQGGLCWLCDRPMLIDLSMASHGHYASFDHVQPLSKGGANSRANIKLAHRKCNCNRKSGDES